MLGDQIICLLNNSEKYFKENMGHPIQTLEAEDARLLLESSPEVPFPFQHFYMNMVHYYCHGAKDNKGLFVSFGSRRGLLAYVYSGVFV